MQYYQGDDDVTYFGLVGMYSVMMPSLGRGSTDAEIKVFSGENQDGSKNPSSRLEIDQNNGFHASPVARNFSFLIHAFLAGLFFPN